MVEPYPSEKFESQLGLLENPNMMGKIKNAPNQQSAGLVSPLSTCIPITSGLQLTPQLLTTRDDLLRGLTSGMMGTSVW